MKTRAQFCDVAIAILLYIGFVWWLHSQLITPTKGMKTGSSITLGADKMITLSTNGFTVSYTIEVVSELRFPEVKAHQTAMPLAVTMQGLRPGDILWLKHMDPPPEEGMAYFGHAGTNEATIYAINTSDKKIKPSPHFFTLSSTK